MGLDKSQAESYLRRFEAIEEADRPRLRAGGRDPAWAVKAGLSLLDAVEWPLPPEIVRLRDEEDRAARKVWDLLRERMRP